MIIKGYFLFLSFLINVVAGSDSDIKHSNTLEQVHNTSNLSGIQTNTTNGDHPDVTESSSSLLTNLSTLAGEALDGAKEETTAVISTAIETTLYPISLHSSVTYDVNNSFNIEVTTPSIFSTSFFPEPDDILLYFEKYANVFGTGTNVSNSNFEDDEILDSVNDSTEAGAAGEDIVLSSSSLQANASDAASSEAKLKEKTLNSSSLSDSVMSTEYSILKAGKSYASDVENTLKAEFEAEYRSSNLNRSSFNESSKGSNPFQIIRTSSPLITWSSPVPGVSGSISAAEPIGAFPVDDNIPNEQSSNVTFYVKIPYKVVEGENPLITWSSTIPGVAKVLVTVKDDFVSVIASHEEMFYDYLSNVTEYTYVNLSTAEAITVEGLINMTAKFIGYNDINVVLFNQDGEKIGNGSLLVGVKLKIQWLGKIYQITLTVIMIIVYTNMGANLDLGIVRNIIKQPIGPAIGLFSQYGCMPLIAFALGVIFFPDDPLFRLGLFASGSAPGGGMSNMWTHLMGGSLDLSIMMTFASTIAALAAVPFWLLTLGKVIVQDASFVIPYTNVLVGIAILILPCFVGIFIQLKLPTVRKIMKILLTPLSIVNIIFIFTFGIYTNHYLFSYLTWRAVLAGFGQTIFGLLIGYVIALFFRRSKADRIAISIETAVQNNGIAFLLMKMSLEPPAGDLAVLLPGCVALFTPLPLALLLLIKTCIEKILAYVKGEDKEKNIEEKPENDSKQTENNNITIVLNGPERGIDNPAMDNTHV